MSNRRTKSESVCFKIEGEFITQTVRDLWFEGNYSGAMNVIGSMIGMTAEQQMDVIMGRAKLTGVNTCELVEDDWTPPDGFRSLEQVFIMASQQPSLEQEVRWRKDFEARELIYWWMDNPLSTSNAGDEKDFKHDRAVKLVGEARVEELKEEWSETIGTG